MSRQASKQVNAFAQFLQGTSWKEQSYSGGVASLALSESHFPSSMAAAPIAAAGTGKHEAIASSTGFFGALAAAGTGSAACLPPAIQAPFVFSPSAPASSSTAPTFFAPAPLTVMPQIAAASSAPDTQPFVFRPSPAASSSDSVASSAASSAFPSSVAPPPQERWAEELRAMGFSADRVQRSVALSDTLEAAMMLCLAESDDNCSAASAAALPVEAQSLLHLHSQFSHERREEEERLSLEAIAALDADAARERAARLARQSDEQQHDRALTKHMLKAELDSGANLNFPGTRLPFYDMCSSINNSHHCLAGSWRRGEFDSRPRRAHG